MAGESSNQGGSKPVSKSKQIAEKFERLLQHRLTLFFRVEVAAIALALFSLILAAITAGFLPYFVSYNGVVLAADCLIIAVATFGANLFYIRKALDKTQYTITIWFAIYILVFLLSIAAQVLLVLTAIGAVGACREGASAEVCTNPAAIGIIAFNNVVFFTLLSLRGATLWMGYQLYILLTKTLNAVVRSTAKVDMRRSISTRRSASFHSVDGSERIVDPVPRKPVPAAFVGGESKVSLAHQPDPSLAV